MQRRTEQSVDRRSREGQVPAAQGCPCRRTPRSHPQMGEGKLLLQCEDGAGGGRSLPTGYRHQGIQCFGRWEICSVWGRFIYILSFPRVTAFRETKQTLPTFYGCSIPNLPGPSPYKMYSESPWRRSLPTTFWLWTPLGSGDKSLDSLEMPRWIPALQFGHNDPSESG